MDLTTFDGLQAATDHYLMDYGLDPVDLATLVQTGASETYRIARTIGMEEYVGSVLVGASNIVALPDRYISLKAFRVLMDGRMRPMTRRTPEWFFENIPLDRRVSGYPHTEQHFCRDGNRFVVAAPENTEVEYVYYKRPENFSVSVQSNWFTLNAGDVILWASLANSAPFVKQDERLPLWRAQWLQGVDSLNAENQEEEGSGSGMAMGLG